VERFFRVLLLAVGFAALGVLVAKVSFCPEITGGDIISEGCGDKMLALTVGGAGFGALVGAIIPWDYIGNRSPELSFYTSIQSEVACPIL